MAWVAVAIGGSAVIGGITANKASKAQSRSAADASAAQLQAAQESNALQKNIYDQNRADSAPWANAGEGALNQLAWKMGITPTTRVDPVAPPIQDASTFDAQAYLKANPDVARSPYKSNPYQHYLDYGKGEGRKGTFIAPPVVPGQNKPYQGKAGDFGSLSRSFTRADFQADPGYQFRMDEGNKGIERSAAARGGQLSGATMKALARFGQNTASDEYQNSYNRFNNDQSTQFNRLSGISGTGQTQINQLGQAGQNYANNVGNNTINTGNQIAGNLIGAGNARAGSYMATGNAINNAIGTGVNYWQQQNSLNNMNNLGGGSGSVYTGGYTPDYGFGGNSLGNPY